MEIEEVMVSVPSDRKTKTCNKCLKNVEVHVACFKCRNIYHGDCLLEAPTSYVNEKGHIFCCQNITSQYNSFESKLQAPETKNGISIEKAIYGLENSRLRQEKHENGGHIHDTCFEKREILEEPNRNRGLEYSTLKQEEHIKDEYLHDVHFKKISRVVFACSFCDVTCFDEESYRCHIKLYEESHLRLKEMQNSDKKLKVDKCDVSNYRWYLKTHSTVHSCEKSRLSGTSQVEHYDSDMCEYRTASQNNLGEHILRNHNNKGRKYIRDYYIYSDPAKANLTQHEHAHFGEKQFKCDTCEFKTVHKKRLVSHMLAKHSDLEKKYKCDLCEFSFHRKDHLRQHMITHSKEKPFKCNDCEFACRRKDRLRVHMSIHCNEKPFKCNDCEYSTRRKDHLKEHTNTHLKKPYK